MEVARSPGRDTGQAKQSRETVNSTIPWGLGRRQPTPGLQNKSHWFGLVELKPSTMTSASALGLPDLAKPFTLYVTEKEKVAMGVLSQTMGTWDRPVTFL